MLLLIYTVLSWIFAILLYRGSIASLGYTNFDHATDHAGFKQQRNATNSMGPDGLFIFLQISDLHISVFGHSDGIDHLKSFLSTELPMLSPEKVIVTGDLTDAKSRFKMSSSQYYQEWHDYHEALLNAGIFSFPDFWLDQRGNHDCSDVAEFDHPSNHFKSLSSTKKEGYAIHLKKDYGTYLFLGVDGCPKYGTKRPFNFFGTLDQQDLNFMQDSMMVPANHTFVMSHYPSGTMVKGFSSTGADFEYVTSNVSVWFSGHLHNLIGGLGETMYHRKQNGFLELELGDMKVHKMYRIMAVDNDVISFRDLSLSEKSYESMDPIVLITYPKDGRFLTKNEPRTVLSKNAYIRFLLWAGEKRDFQFIISIDGVVKQDLVPVYTGVGHPWKNKTVGSKEEYTPLWTIKWDPTEYNDGLIHTMTIKVEDGASSKFSASAAHSITFSYDGDLINDLDSGSGGFIVSIDFNLLFKTLFLTGYIFLFFGLLVLPKLWVAFLTQRRSYRPWKTTISKWILKSEMANKASFYGLIQRFTYRWILRLCHMASDQTTLWTSYFILANCIISLPWFFGDFVPSSQDPNTRWGFSFLYGILFLDGTWIPMIDSWAYSALTLLGTIIPFYLYFSCWYEPLETLFSSVNISRVRPIHRRWYVSFLIAYLWLYSSLDIFFMLFYYGKWAVLMNQRTWFLGFIALNLYWAWRNATFTPVDSVEEHEAPQVGISLRRKHENSPSSYNLRSRSSLN